MIAVAAGLDVPAALRVRLADLYGAYDDALAEGQYERWPEFFTEACVYKITSRENHDSGLPVALIYAESRAMLRDRVAALRKTLLYAPRMVRNLTGGTVLRALAADGL